MASAAASVLPGIIEEVASWAAKAALTKGAESVMESPTGFLEGLKEGGKKLLEGDFSGAAEQARNFFFGPRKTPTEQIAEELAQSQKKRPKDVARRYAPGPKRRKDKKYMLEDDLEDEEEPIPGIRKPKKKGKVLRDDDFEMVNDTSGIDYDAERPRGGISDTINTLDLPSMIASTPVSTPSPPTHSAATKAPVRVPVIHLPGGRKPVPGEPSGKSQFVSSRLTSTPGRSETYEKHRFVPGKLFPVAPPTGQELRRAEAMDRHKKKEFADALEQRRRMAAQLERIYGPMDTTVRSMKRQIASSEYGNTSGPYVPEVKHSYPAYVPPPGRKMIMTKDNHSGPFPDQTPVMKLPNLEGMRLPPPSYKEAMRAKDAREALRPKAPALEDLWAREMREAAQHAALNAQRGNLSGQQRSNIAIGARGRGFEVPGSPLAMQKKSLPAPPPGPVPPTKIAAEAKTGKPLKGAAKASFEKSQVKITVPKKKLVKK